MWERLTPRPLILNLERPKSQPSRDDSAEVPQTVVHGGDSTAMLRMCNLCQQQWRGQLCESTSEADEESGYDEHSKVHRGSLNGDAEEEYQTSRPNGWLTSILVRNVRRKRQAAQRSNGEYATVQSEQRSGRVFEVLLPRRQSLKTLLRPSVRESEIE